MVEPFTYAPQLLTIHEREQQGLIEVVPYPCDLNKPLEFARELVRRVYTRDGIVTLALLGRRWHQWNGTRWAPFDTEDRFRQSLYLKLDGAFYLKPGKTKDDEPRPVEIIATKAKLANVIDPVAALVPYTRPDDDRNVWLQAPARGDLPTDGLPIPMRNGVLDTTTRKLYEHSPNLMNTWALQFDYDPTATCPQWLAFLKGAMPGDDKGITFLQEWIGYLISGETRTHKAVLVTGAPRAGKGVMTDVITHLLGEGNTQATSFQLLNEKFGLANVEGQKLLVIPDSRDGGKPTSTATGHILSLTANDPVPVEHKGKDAYTRRLNTRLMVFSNEIPRLPDNTRAIGTRFICLDLPVSHVGKEDTDLTARLLSELPGVFNWALDGLDRLKNNGWKFTALPKDHNRIIANVTDQASPISVFVDTVLELRAGEWATLSSVHEAYKRWCDGAGYKPKNQQTFLASLDGLRLPNVKVSRKTTRGGDTTKKDYIDGVKLRPQDLNGWHFT
ncbi:DNA primase family protein [Corynebacterium glucuronolyticum]